MAITVSGVEADLDVTEWAEYMEAHAAASPSPDGVLAGFSVSVATGTRLLSVSSGSAIAPGVLADSTAAKSVTLDANASGNPRIDAVVLEVNWSGNAATAGDVKFVKGTAGASPSRPTLTRVPGSVWQIPLAWVTVANGAGQLAAGNIEPAYSQVDTGWVQASFGSGWEAVPGVARLAARRKGGTVMLSGRLRRSGSATSVGSSLGFQGVPMIPRSFWPSQQVPGVAMWDMDGSPKFGGFLLGTDGTATLTPGTATLATGDIVHLHLTWEV